MGPAEDTARPGPLTRRDGGPAFDEPWQAQVMALAFTLVEDGTIDPPQWSQTLGAELLAARSRGEPDDADSYYRSALAALEKLLSSDGRITPQALTARTEAWRQAYLNTPHGAPVELAASGGSQT